VGHRHHHHAGRGLVDQALPLEQYPDIAPPRVTIGAQYTGASAETVENSVTQIIEQQIKGIDNMLYMSSTSNASGQARITLTFAPGTNVDVAQVQVQNKIQGDQPPAGCGEDARRVHQQGRPGLSGHLQLLAR
jgi:multidrug efflux pump subunit AcrB